MHCFAGKSWNLVPNLVVICVPLVTHHCPSRRTGCLPHKNCSAMCPRDTIKTLKEGKGRSLKKDPWDCSVSYVSRQILTWGLEFHIDPKHLYLMTWEGNSMVNSFSRITISTFKALTKTPFRESSAKGILPNTTGHLQRSCFNTLTRQSKVWSTVGPLCIRFVLACPTDSWSD